MTVGIAALAQRRSAIVLIADKQFTDEVSGLRVEGHDVKAFQLVNGLIVLYAGDATFATVVVNRAETAVRERTVKLSDAVSVMNWMREAYLDVYEEEIDRALFRPNLLDKDKFVQRSYDEATIRDIEARTQRFQENATCELLVCGFDADDDGQIIRIGAEVAEVCDSYSAIGSGGPFADAHLAWRRTQSSDSLQRVVYEVYEAKLHAELNAYVGPTDDFLVMYSNRRDEVRRLTNDTKDLLKQAIGFHDFTPFRDAGASREGEKRPPQPEDWERVLAEDKLGPIIGDIRRRTSGTT